MENDQTRDPENLNDTTGAAANTETSTSTDAPEGAEKSEAAAAGAGTASKRVVSKNKKDKGASKGASKRASKKAAAETTGGRRLVTATLEKRLVRVRFMRGKDVVAESAPYNTGNTLDKIVAYARRQIGSAKIGDAKAKPQESHDGGKHWVNVAMPTAETAPAQ